ncbi:MAG: hypothetical protein Q4E53_14015 [Eubacteriales bacterium]|nr:hypothetical protein [Eubacteriales bacterium]
MKKLKKELIAEKRYLEKIIEKTTEKEAEKKIEIISKLTNPKIRITNRKDIRSYYLCSPEICEQFKGGQYLKKDEKYIAKEIVQKEYEEKLRMAAEKKLKIIEELLETMENDSLELVYQNYNLYRKELICPIVGPQEMKVRDWLSQTYNKKTFAEGTPEIYTEHGERVRSKSEKIIADLLYKNGIPYLYEKPLLLSLPNQKNIIVYPDFTILDIANRREVYLEHFGKMDDMEYVEKAIRKINTYEKTGISQGDKLFITYESLKYPLDTRTLESLIRRNFIS